jgi:amidase
MTRTVEDAARMLGVIAGQDEADATSLASPVPNYMGGEHGADGMRIGIDWSYATQGVSLAVVEGLREAIAHFEAAGAELVEIEMPGDYASLVEGWAITCAVDCVVAHAGMYPEQADQYGQSLARLLDLGMTVDRARYDQLERLRASFRSELDVCLAGVDLVISPCMTTLPPTIAEMETPGGFNEEGLAPFLTFTAPFDYSGHPTLSLPLALGELALPRSFQLIGPHLGEDRLIRAGLAFEKIRGAPSRPPIA